MIKRKYFTQAEAEAKIGRRIKTLVEFSGVPKDTTGEVIRADPMGQTRLADGTTRDTFDVGIQWDLPRPQPRAEAVYPASTNYEPHIFIQTGKPLIDWFSRDEYEQYLVELENQEPSP